MNQFKNSCVMQFDKIALKLDSRLLPMPRPIAAETQDFDTRHQSLRSAFKEVKEGEPNLVSRVHSIGQDVRLIQRVLDGLKSAYVLDNTRKIEFEEICSQH